MANPSWDGLLQYCFHTVALGASTAKLSETFNIPRGVQTVTFITPTYTTDTVTAVEGLSPLDKTTWTAVKVYQPDPTTPTWIALTLPTASYVTIPATALGTGTFRFSNTTDQIITVPTIVIFDRAGSH